MVSRKPLGYSSFSLIENEMLVLGLLGKLLTGPWMQMFYTSAESELNCLNIGAEKVI